jgi:hypothetical protein
MTPETLSQTLETFLAGAGDAVALEDGMVAFDLAQAKYSISGETHKCLLHLWSSERKVVRRVVDMETKRDTLKLQCCAWDRRVRLSWKSAAPAIRGPRPQNARPESPIRGWCIACWNAAFRDGKWFSFPRLWTWKDPSARFMREVFCVKVSRLLRFWASMRKRHRTLSTPL